MAFAEREAVSTHEAATKRKNEKELQVTNAAGLAVRRAASRTHSVQLQLPWSERHASARGTTRSVTLPCELPRAVTLNFIGILLEMKR